MRTSTRVRIQKPPPLDWKLEERKERLIVRFTDPAIAERLTTPTISTVVWCPADCRGRGGRRSGLRLPKYRRARLSLMIADLKREGASLRLERDRSASTGVSRESKSRPAQDGHAERVEEPRG